MAGEKKTNAARILDRAKVTYRLVPYMVDENNLAADHVAEQLGEPIERVFKTLVLRGDRNGLFVCVIAGNREVDLKKAAKVSGNKKAEMIHQKELLPLTGYIRGGCTAIGMKKHFPTFFSSEFCDYDRVYVSAGQRGLQLEVPPVEFMKVAQGELADLTTDNDLTE
ncbi:MAG: Cys-tRNA(Pro) deacylase [Muribaculaceae bacterium]|nr:Cys-tRNA(Pro) deacylase [Muribaculaceae bacterium]